MKFNLRYVQWLVFWFSAYLPFAVMAADAAPATMAISDFPSTEPELETLRDEQAIDNQIITALAPDSRGLIWIGTQNGLVRYDGYRFRRFVQQSNDQFSLASSYVKSLVLAKDGRLWVGTIADGISVFDPASERFEHFRHDTNAPDSLAADQILAWADDGRGGMWITTNSGLDHIPVGGKRFVHFRHSNDPHSLLSDKVRTLLLDKASRLWVGSASGLQRPCATNATP